MNETFTASQAWWTSSLSRTGQLIKTTIKKTFTVTIEFLQFSQQKEDSKFFNFNLRQIVPKKANKCQGSFNYTQ